MPSRQEKVIFYEVLGALRDSPIFSASMPAFPRATERLAAFFRHWDRCHLAKWLRDHRHEVYLKPMRPDLPDHSHIPHFSSLPEPRSLASSIPASVTDTPPLDAIAQSSVDFLVPSTIS
jgi:hypothetical protein